jgi:hypothetical protein
MSKKYMIHVGPSGSVFVKDYDFFIQQHGDTQEWGKHWQQIPADSIEDARQKACGFPGARPYNRQA